MADSRLEQLRLQCAAEIAETEALLDEQTRLRDALTDGIGAKIKRIQVRMELLRMKYSSYRRMYNGLNLFIITLSSTVALYETFKATLLDDTYPHFAILSLIPAAASSVVAMVGSVVKFKKLSERMEELGRCIERCIATVARLRRVVEDAAQATTTTRLTEVQSIYSGEIYDQYTATMQMIDTSLKFKDLVVYLPYYARLSAQLADIGGDELSDMIVNTSGHQRSRLFRREFWCCCCSWLAHGPAHWLTDHVNRVSVTGTATGCASPPQPAVGDGGLGHAQSRPNTGNTETKSAV